MTAQQRIVVGLSGGVDSAVTAYLLKQQGYEVIGIFMKNWEDDDDSEYCSSNIDFVDAAAVADVIGIEIEHVNFAAEYKRPRVRRVPARVPGRPHAQPRHPVQCRDQVQGVPGPRHAPGRREDRHRSLCSGAAEPGHRSNTSCSRGWTRAKDQSYFLHRLNQAQLSKTLFPVGELHKTEVRRIAAEIGLPNAKKKDSTGICFIGERPFRDFLNRYISKEPGPIKDDDGRTIGQHVGLSFYTLGQRQGLGIGGIKAQGAALKAVQAKGLRGAGEHEPWFVARKDMANNTLWAVQGHDHPWLLSHALKAGDASWCAGDPPAPGDYGAKTPLPADGCRVQPAPGHRRHLRPSLRARAMGRHARPKRRAVRRRGLPGRRRDRSSRRLTGMGRATSVASHHFSTRV
jgi:tRNA-specific 2-thiouridylase